MKEANAADDKAAGGAVLRPARGRRRAGVGGGQGHGRPRRDGRHRQPDPGAVGGRRRARRSCPPRSRRRPAGSTRSRTWPRRASTRSCSPRSAWAARAAWSRSSSASSSPASTSPSSAGAAPSAGRCPTPAGRWARPPSPPPTAPTPSPPSPSASGPVGTFALAGLPAPATYAISVAKEGFGTETRIVDLAPDQKVTGFDGRPQPGQGLDLGDRVRARPACPCPTCWSRCGPGRARCRCRPRSPRHTTLPVAPVRASDFGPDVLGAAITLADGPVGFFSIGGLPTPGTFTVTLPEGGLPARHRHHRPGRERERDQPEPASSSR